ncbi:MULTISPECIES: hypothetical protein [unclassified Brevundimonas]|uniref:hypothetical protein n=1 Tax=unclassified Brevundimonas TaxID=2622653 RepID=UPI0025C09ED0|nr:MULTISPECIES: hypothetical protein [unclassified Brevundimonas]
MDRTEVVTGIANELYATELAVDDAISHAAAMVQALIAGRNELSISAIAGTASQTKAMETLAALSAAREAIVSCHEEMQKDHRRMGWGTYAAGTRDKPSDLDKLLPGNHYQPHLRAV